MSSLVQDAACRAMDAIGGGGPLARALGMTRQRVHYWRKRGIPADQVLRVSEITGVPPHELRPDLYPHPSQGANDGASQVHDER